MTRRPMRAINLLLARAAGARERGSSTIQMVVLLPALFTLMFLGVQGALLYQGRTVALAAAQEGARAAAAESSSAGIGISAAYDYVSSTTVGLKGTVVTGNRSATQASITVSSRTVSVIPGFSPTVVQSASMPVERVTG